MTFFYLRLTTYDSQLNSTGHEHLEMFALINMNNRMYDPVIGRMLAPDNYVQEPGFTQNYNRYSYAWNNPLIYTDPDGDIVLSFTVGFIDGFFSTGSGRFEAGWDEGKHRATNSIRITRGLFESDETKSDGRRAWEIVSRFTWQMPQTALGLAYSHSKNIRGDVNWVEYYGGATVVSADNQRGGVALGSFIVANSERIEVDPENELFQHEYGHYLQSQAAGPVYLTKYGLPSLFSAGGSGNHEYHPVEQDANRRALEYFEGRYPGFAQDGWHFDRNPIIGYNESLPFDHSHNQSVLRSHELNPLWWDYATLIVRGPVVNTTINLIINR